MDKATFARFWEAVDALFEYVEQEDISDLIPKAQRSAAVVDTEEARSKAEIANTKTEIESV